jgi:hypothetical protein
MTFHSGKVGRSFDQVLEILFSESRSLKTLAYMSGYDPFEFYRSADLTNIDLSNQVLTGLNFDKADLTGSNLAGVSYDKGAFNNSILPDEAKLDVDEFDSYFQDLLEDDLGRVYIFAKIRGEVLDLIAQGLSLSYGDFAVKAGISAATLRKARRSEAVSIDTAQAIWRSVKDTLFAPGFEEYASKARQPTICFLELKHSGGFRELRRESYLRALTTARKLYALRKERNYPEYVEYWRDSPTGLDFYDRLYFSAHEPDPPELSRDYEAPELDFGLFKP